MKINIYPDEIKKSVLDIDLKKLKEENIHVLICDVDNTLCLHDEEEISKDKMEWLKQAVSFDMKIILISNNHVSRIERVARLIDAKAYGFALKPFPFTYMKMLKENKISKDEAICIGDQLFTDIFGAKFMGIRNIYVHPMSESDIIYTKLSRAIENYILKEKL